MSVFRVVGGLLIMSGIVLSVLVHAQAAAAAASAAAPLPSASPTSVDMELEEATHADVFEEIPIGM
jgi:D-aminopeptidase